MDKNKNHRVPEALTPKSHRGWDLDLWGSNRASPYITTPHHTAIFLCSSPEPQMSTMLMWKPDPAVATGWLWHVMVIRSTKGSAEPWLLLCYAYSSPPLPRTFGCWAADSCLRQPATKSSYTSFPHSLHINTQYTGMQDELATGHKVCRLIFSTTEAVQQPLPLELYFFPALPVDQDHQLEE